MLLVWWYRNRVIVKLKSKHFCSSGATKLFIHMCACFFMFMLNRVNTGAMNTLRASDKTEWISRQIKISCFLRIQLKIPPSIRRNPICINNVWEFKWTLSMGVSINGLIWLPEKLIWLKKYELINGVKIWPLYTGIQVGPQYYGIHTHT